MYLVYVYMCCKYICRLITFERLLCFHVKFPFDCSRYIKYSTHIEFIVINVALSFALMALPSFKWYVHSKAQMNSIFCFPVYIGDCFVCSLCLYGCVSVCVFLFVYHSTPFFPFDLISFHLHSHIVFWIKLLMQLSKHINNRPTDFGTY